jgi:endonuclease/exonuclease/phosphatase family metal-dependent hydrolase
MPSRHYTRTTRFQSRAAVLACALAAVLGCESSKLPVAPRNIAAGTASDVVPDSGLRSDQLTVMTYNIYQGTELQNTLAATNASEFVMGAAADFAMMHETNFPARAQVIAAEIQAADPDLVAMQEVALWRTGVTQFPSVPAITVDQDFLQILLDALAARGDPYAVVSLVQNMDVQGPALLPTGLTDVRLTDRNVILAKATAATARLGLSNPQSSNFATNLVIQTAVGTVPIKEGWASIDVRLAGRTVRFITTHLDAFAPPIRLAQANEILTGVANTTMPVILAGDLNSTTDATSYAAITGAGFADVWSVLEPGVDGFTCCEASPTIDNDIPSLSQRIDYVLERGALLPIYLNIIGATPISRTSSGLWPSDHAGLIARLRIQPLL